MSDIFYELSTSHIEFIQKQKMFFVGTAGAEGFINVSPKGMDSFRVIDNLKVVWLNLTGSGNETAAHVLENNRMTVMFCSFDKQPLIVRLYGDARVLHPRDADWEKYTSLFPEYLSARQIFELDLEMVQNSCGYGVPYYELQGERPALAKWAEKHGKHGIEEYWNTINRRSLNDRDTGILEK